MKRKILLVLLGVGLILGLLGVVFAQEKPETFRFRFLWRGEDPIFQRGFSPDGYGLSQKWDIYNWFGLATWASQNNVGGWVGTYTLLPYEKGDSVPLFQTRRVNGLQTGNSNFGFEAEVKVADNMWLGVAYLSSPTFCINTAEESESAVFSRFQLTYWSRAWEYAEYNFEFERQCRIQNTSEKISPVNFQLYYKLETKTTPAQVFVKVGVDAWKLERQTTIYTKVFSFQPWMDILTSDSPAEEVSKSDKTDWLMRMFLGLGAQISIKASLNIGFEGKVFLGGDFENNLSVKKMFSLPYQGEESWKFQLGKYSLAGFLSFGF
jgi:hypothetical protein